jgi:hypothetical protein
MATCRAGPASHLLKQQSRGYAVLEIAGVVISGVGLLNDLWGRFKDLSAWQENDLLVDNEYLPLALSKGVLQGAEADYLWSNEDKVATRELGGTHCVVIAFNVDRKVKYRIVRGRPHDRGHSDEEKSLKPPMFANPTIDDFIKLLDWHLDNAVGLSERSFKTISHRRNAKGMFRSGGTIIEGYDAVHVDFKKGIEAALGELKRIALKTTLDRNTMRKVAEERLRAFAETCKSATKPDMLRSFGPPGPIQERLSKFDAILEHSLRQFDVGFLDVAEPEVPPTMSTSMTTYRAWPFNKEVRTPRSTSLVNSTCRPHRPRLAPSKGSWPPPFRPLPVSMAR